MDKFNYSDVSRYSYRFEDVSEPLKEFKMNYDGSISEVSTSCSLLGVKQNGKWGWIDTNERFIIPALYDSGFVVCSDNIIILDKDGCQGGIYRDNLGQAFQFRYQQLGQFYRDTYCAWNFNNRCALLKPGDVRVTDFKYKGFSKYNQCNVTEYVRTNFFGIEIHGTIDILTGRELT